MLGDWPGSTENDLTGVRDRLASLVASGSGGLLGSGWWGHPGYALSPEQNLLLFAHYAEALDWQSKFMRIHAILGGKDPHAQTYLVGGMALAPPWGGPDVRLNRGHPDVPQHNSPDPLGEDGLTMIDDLLREGRRFVEQVFLPDVRLVADAYRDWTAIGDGGTGYLAFGDYPQRDGAAPDLFLPRGSVASGTLRVDDVDEAKVAEAVVHAWYQDESIAAGHLVPPASGDTNPDFDLDLPIASLEGADRYTWVKAPRYEGRPMETGPLARVMVAYADGQPEVGTTLSELLRGLSLGPEAMASVIGRLLARAVEAQVVVIRAANWLRELRQHLSTGDLAVADISSWDPGTWPAEAEGWSLGEGPRGAVGHWVSIRDGRVDRYQVVDASTWNASPRDLFGIAGPMEAALAGTAVADEAQPIELLRVIHSYNPCLACAAHLHGGGLTSRVSLRVRHGEGHR